MTVLPASIWAAPLRDELIGRVHRRFGPEFASLAWAVSTWSVKGVIKDLDNALGLPKDDLKLLSKQGKEPRLREEMHEPTRRAYRNA